MTLHVRCSQLVLAALAWVPTVAPQSSDGEKGAAHPFETDAERAPAFQTGGSAVVRNVTIHPVSSTAFVGDVYVADGKIAALGQQLAVPEGTLELDGTDRHLAPGVVDNHSHMAMERGINEGTLSITCDVDVSDVVDADDLTIYRALAGGVTTARLLHGSANVVGGKHEVIKLKWGRSAEELSFEGAPEGVKFALGENPKRRGGRGDGRFPGSRMGVEAVLERAFPAARQYSEQWDAYEAGLARGEDPLPPRRDLRLETLAGVLDGSVHVHSHCYRADEILMLMRCAERFGFRIQTLQHVLEGYKVAKEIADHGAGASTFGDWWAYKIEAYDAIPHNAALLTAAGVLTSVNSDDNEMVRRLRGEAAKSVRHGGLDRDAALALVTLNSAAQLGIADRVGSIEVGKDADLVLLDREPLSSLARVAWTMVDGEIEFTARDAFGLADDPPPVRELKGAGAERDAYDPDGPAPIALVGGTLHPASGAPIDNGVLVLQADRIVRIGGSETRVPRGASVVDCAGLDLWPGLIALGTSLGLFEIDQVTATVDLAEIGGNQPDVRTASAIHADSAHFGVTLEGGITRAESAPERGGPLRGRACVVKLVGDTWEELVFEPDTFLHLDYPRVANDAEKREEGDEQKALARMFDDALDYARLLDDAAEHGTPAPDYDPRLEALAPYARGERRIALWAENAQTILFALRFATERELDVVLYGAREGWKVAERIAAAGVPVVVGPVHALPRDRFDPYDAPFANAALLARAGCEVAIQCAERTNQRNLAFHAATALAHGLPRVEALRAITLYPARILGLDERLGSLEVGKLADVVVTRGDLFEITSRVERVFVDGVEVELENRQTELYERYKARLERMLR